MTTIQYACCSGYRDEVSKDNKINQNSVGNKLWERPLREHEVKVLRSKVQNHKHKKDSGKAEASIKQDNNSHSTEKKSSHLHTILKSKTTAKKSTQAKTGDKAIKHGTADSRSMVFKENQLKPQLHKAYRMDEADILEGDDDEGDVLPYSRGKRFKVVNYIQSEAYHLEASKFSLYVGTEA